jgi:hypothetical protein
MPRQKSEKKGGPGPVDAAELNEKAKQRRNECQTFVLHLARGESDNDLNYSQAAVIRQRRECPL